MTIKRLLVYVDGSKHAAQTIKGACEAAKPFQARLDGFCVIPDVTTALAAAPDGIAVPDLVSEMQRDAEERAASARRLFEEEKERAGFNGEWRSFKANGRGTSDVAASVARHADLVVVGQTDPEEEPPRDPSMPGDLILDAGRPVLLIPHGWDGGAFGRTILVGWKETRESARALFDSLPFLKRARSVVVVTVAKEKRRQEAARSLEHVAASLGAHGIAPTVEAISGWADGGASDALLAHAAAVGADMVVIGGYSHSRLREGIFGGVTRAVIERSPYAALLSH